MEITISGIDANTVRVIEVSVTSMEKITKEYVINRELCLTNFLRDRASISNHILEKQNILQSIENAINQLNTLEGFL